MPAFETSALSFGDLCSSGKGAKTVPLLGPNTYSPGELRVLWEPKSFDGTDQNRVSISFSPTSDVEADVLDLEKWVIARLSVDSRKYFGQELTEAQVRDRFVSALKTSEKGFRSLRAKMNFTGRNGVQCWDQNKQKRELPDDWLCSSVTPIFRVKGLWIMSREMGLLFEMEHAQIGEAKAECPF
jgi:hypothetical protein